MDKFQFDAVTPAHGLKVLALFLAVLGFFSRFVVHGSKPKNSIGWRPLPQPQTLPIIKNLHYLNIKEPLKSMSELSKSYRDCFRLELPGLSFVIINSHRLYNEVCDTKRFHKESSGALYEARNGGGDGLFTAFTHEENWGIAHRILAPYFGQLGVKDLFEDMYSMTCDLADEWEKIGSSRVFDPYEEFCKFTLDTIAHCAFDLKTNSMKDGVPHYFGVDMTYFFSESGKRAVRPGFVTKYILRDRNRRYWEAIQRVHTFSRQVMTKRQVDGSRKKDILDGMMHNVDPLTGKKMTEESCMFNTLAILAAGQETMSSMMSWTLIMLLKNPQCLAKVQQELQEQLGHRPITLPDIEGLSYLNACIRETLRLYPSAYAHTVKLRKEAIGANDRGLGEEQYLVSRSDILRLNLVAIHRDPLVWGKDADTFKPERMMGESFEKLPRNAWKPFGNGVRICLGRFLALQQGCITLATLLQRFNFEFVDDRCGCHIGETLILHPVDCTMRATTRRVEAETEH